MEEKSVQSKALEAGIGRAEDEAKASGRENMAWVLDLGLSLPGMGTSVDYLEGEVTRRVKERIHDLKSMDEGTLNKEKVKAILFDTKCCFPWEKEAFEKAGGSGTGWQNPIWKKFCEEVIVALTKDKENFFERMASEFSVFAEDGTISQKAS